MVLSTRLEDPLWTYRSYLGKQPNSKLLSAPEWGFGTAPPATIVPLVPSSLPGPGAYSAKKPSPSLNIPFKTCLSWAAMQCGGHADCSAHRSGAPGPTKYRTCTAHMMGATLPIGNLCSSPRFSWTRGSSREARSLAYVSRGHERENYGLHSPGPATAHRLDSIGMQCSSLQRTQPRFAQVKEKRFLTLKAGDPSLTPGPGAYNV